MKDSISFTVQKITDLGITTKLYNNFWFWISIVEIIVILILIIYISKKLKTPNNHNIKTQAISGKVDFDNIVRSSFYATELYNKLKVKCHPDRFLDPTMNLEANHIFQEITKNKTNLKRLEELKLKAIEVLNIKF